jgi:hypothetical protein
VRVDQEPADAGQRAFGRPLFPGDDEDRMRARGPECGREPADHKRQIGGIDIDVFSQEGDRAVACRNRKSPLAGRPPQMDIRPFDDLPPGGLSLDPLPRGIAQVEKDGRA